MSNLQLILKMKLLKSDMVMLRRHLNTITTQKDREIALLKEQLDKATKKQIKFPKTDEEISLGLLNILKLLKL